MFRRFVIPSVLAAVGDFFKKNPNQDNPNNRAKYERYIRNRSGGWSYPVSGGGSQEAERRRRQIAAGQLRYENGLVRPGQMVEEGGRITILRPWCQSC